MVSGNDYDYDYDSSSLQHMIIEGMKMEMEMSSAIVTTTTLPNPASLMEKKKKKSMAKTMTTSLVSKVLVGPVKVRVLLRVVKVRVLRAKATSSHPPPPTNIKAKTSQSTTIPSTLRNMNIANLHRSALLPLLPTGTEAATAATQVNTTTTMVIFSKMWPTNKTSLTRFPISFHLLCINKMATKMREGHILLLLQVR